MARLQHVSAELLVMAGLGLLFGLLGPFGTFAYPVATRVGMWLVMALGGYACFRPVIGASRALAEQTHMPLAAALALACIIASLPVTLLVGLVFGGQVDAGSLAERYPYVVLVGGLATTIQVLLFARRQAITSTPVAAVRTFPEPVAPAPEEIPAAPPGPAAFLDRLPPHLGRDLLCLEMEDHYVRAHTASGSTLILMRMRDAVGELAGIEGERVHRSWWVARAAVAQSHRRERATLLLLSNGLEVPVARDSVAMLRSRGWL